MDLKLSELFNFELNIFIFSNILTFFLVKIFIFKHFGFIYEMNHSHFGQDLFGEFIYVYYIYLYILGSFNEPLPLWSRFIWGVYLFNTHNFFTARSHPYIMNDDHQSSYMDGICSQKIKGLHFQHVQ